MADDGSGAAGARGMGSCVGGKGDAGSDGHVAGGVYAGDAGLAEAVDLNVTKTDRFDTARTAPPMITSSIAISDRSRGNSAAATEGSGGRAPGLLTRGGATAQDGADKRRPADEPADRAHAEHHRDASDRWEDLERVGHRKPPWPP
jgi:hypothetical protein